MSAFMLKNPSNKRVSKKESTVEFACKLGVSMLFRSGLSKRLLMDSFTTAIHGINKLSSPILNMESPCKLLIVYRPNYSSHKSF